jgi:minor extracellular serine protease Vpr
MHRIFYWVAAAIASLSLASGQVVSGRFIVELNGEPAVSSAARKVARGVRVDAKGLAASRANLQAQHNRMTVRIENGRATVRHRIQNVANALVVEMDAQRAAEVAQMAGVKRVHAIRMYRPSLDRAIGLQKVSDAWSQIGGQDQAGLGVKIGIIDTGIDSGHPAFQDPNLTMPAGFPIVNQSTDKIFTSNKIIVARSYDDSFFPGSANDVCGHGTAVSMVAAGLTNVTPLGTITGIAPKAYLGNYKVFPDADQCGAPTDLILQALDDAVADGMDILNMSLGLVPAERPEADILTQAVETATAAGVIVVIAAGNDGPGANTVGTPGSAVDAITLGNSHNDRDFAAPLLVDGVTSPYASYVGSGSQPKAGVQGPLTDVTSADPTSLACNSLPAGSLQGHVALILRGTCTFEAKLNNAQAAGATAAIVYTYASDPDGFPMAVGSAKLPSVMVGNSDGLDIQQRLQQGGSLNATLSFSQTAFFVDPSRLDLQSSRGPNVDNNIKPDLLAVGDSVLTAAPSSLGSYQVASGTSLASPMVAGAAAILKAARPGLTMAQYRSLLINSTAIYSLDGVKPIGVQKGGAGFLNVASALNSTIAVYPTQLGLGSGGNTVNLTSTLTVTNLGKNADSFTITVNSFDGTVVPTISTTTVQLDAGTSQDVTVQTQASNLDPGEYQGLIVVHASSSSIEAHVPYWVGVTANTPNNIVVYSPVTSARHLSRQALDFRALDSIGVPVTATPVVTVVSGGGSVVTTNSFDGDVPGLWESMVRLGPDPVDNVFLITFGDTTQKVTITGQ